MERKHKIYGRERVCASFIDNSINGKTLNIGAGEMQWIENLLFKNDRFFISSDIDPVNVGIDNPSINKMVIDSTKIPLKKEELSQVIILDVLEHIKDHEKALSEIYRVLKSGGRLVVCVPNDTFLSYFNPIRYVQHERHYTIEEITSLLKKHGFRIEKVFAGGRIFELMSLYFHLFFKYFFRKKSNFFDNLRDREYLKHLPNGNEIAILAIKI